MGWGPVPRRNQNGRVIGYTIQNTVTRRVPSTIHPGTTWPTKAAALAAVAAINVHYKRKPEATRRRLEAATAAAATRRRNRNRRRR